MSPARRPWRVLLLNEDQMRLREGFIRHLPGVAFGVRNLGPYEKIDRFAAGYELIPLPDEGEDGATTPGTNGAEATERAKALTQQAITDVENLIDGKLAPATGGATFDTLRVVIA